MAKAKAVKKDVKTEDKKEAVKKDVENKDQKEEELKLDVREKKPSTLHYGLIEDVKNICEYDKRGEESDILLDKLMKLRNVVDESYLAMGGILRKVFDSDLYRDWGYDDWKTFVEEKIGYSLRKAQYLMRIWHYFAVEIGDEETIRKIAPLGWSKIKELVGVIDPDNVDDWVKKCKSSTLSEVSKKATEFLAKKSGVDEEKVVKTATQISFKLFEEQQKNVEDAIELAGKVSGSEVKSNNLSLICLEYLTNNGGLEIKDDEVKLRLMKNSLRNFEIGFGIKLIAIQRLKGEDTILFGEEYVDGTDEE